MTNPRTYGFKLSMATWADCPCVAVELLAREGDCEYPINCSSDGEHHYAGAPKRLQGLMLGGLLARIYRSEYGVRRQGWCFGHAGDVYGDDIARMAKTFKLIDRTLAKLPYDAEIGDWFEASAKAIGATWFAVETRNGRGWSYRDSEWRFAPLAEGKAALRAEWQRLVIEWTQTASYKAAQAAQ